MFRLEHKKIVRRGLEEDRQLTPAAALSLTMLHLLPEVRLPAAEIIIHIDDWDIVRSGALPQRRRAAGMA